MIEIRRRREGGMRMRTNNHHAEATKAFCNWMVADGRSTLSPLSRLQGVTVTDEKTYGAFTVEQARSCYGPRTLAHNTLG